MLGHTLTAWPPQCKTTTICTFQMFNNPQTIYLNRGIERVVAVRVKHLAWNNPVIGSEASMLWLSCPELLINNPSQSIIYTSNPDEPDSPNQLVNVRSLIGSWQITVPEGSPVNYNNNDPQPVIDLYRPTDVNKLTFTLESDGYNATPGAFGPVQFIIPNNQLSVTLEITCQ